MDEMDIGSYEDVSDSQAEYDETINSEIVEYSDDVASIDSLEIDDNSEITDTDLLDSDFDDLPFSDADDFGEITFSETNSELDVGLSDLSDIDDISTIDESVSFDNNIDEDGLLDTSDLSYHDDFEDFVLEENPEFYDTGEFYTQGINEYGFQGTCGPTSQANALNDLFDTNQFTENKILNVAVENDLCDINEDPECAGGTTTEDFMELYDKVNEEIGGGFETELYEYEDALDIDEVAEKIEDGSTINVAVDAYELWDEPHEYVDVMGVPCDDIYTNHWITVSGVHRDETGRVEGFDIIDSGGGVDYVDADKYHDMCFGTDEHHILDPTTIVVSKSDDTDIL